MAEPFIDEEFFAGLRELAESAFPKRCRNCGREYQSSTEFLAATLPLQPDRSGLKQSRDDDGATIVEVFRNCVCGSTLLESFGDRRDFSDAGNKRRQRFQGMQDRLVAHGCPAETARAELLKLMRGQPNDLVRLVKNLKD